MAKVLGLREAPWETNIQFILARVGSLRGPVLKTVLDQSVFHDFRFLEIRAISAEILKAVNLI